MNVSPSYILGQSSLAEHRLELLNELTASSFIEAMKVLPNKGVKILILGCGSGHLEERLAELFVDSHFVGIDISPLRLAEAKSRTAKLKCSNTFQFVEADLTTLTELDPCDILISRFVLSHLTNGIALFNRFLSSVKKGGYICLEENASDQTEFYCNVDNRGYQTWVEKIGLQLKIQQSDFMIGFHFKTELKKRSCTIIYQRVFQPILETERDKSIIRLSFEDAKAVVLHYMKEEELQKTLESLLQFEKDDSAYALYTRSLALIARI